MPFNSHWGNESQPLIKSQFSQNYEHKGSPLPPPTLKYVVDINGNYVVTINDQKVVVGS